MSYHGKFEIQLVVDRVSPDRHRSELALISLKKSDLKGSKIIRAEYMNWTPFQTKLPSLVVSGTTIFLVGGGIGSHGIIPVSDVYSIKVSGSRRVWKKSPSMKGSRLFAETISLDGNIYVFGGKVRSGPWAEVYDIKSKTWSEVKTPVYYCNTHGSPCCSVSYEIAGRYVKKLLYYNDNLERICAYDFILEHWCDLYMDKSKLELKGDEKLEASDSTLFVLSIYRWSAFDLERKVHRGKVSGLDQLFEDLADDKWDLEEIVSLGCKDGKHNFIVFLSDSPSLLVERIEVIDEGKNGLCATIFPLGTVHFEDGVRPFHHYVLEMSDTTQQEVEDDESDTEVWYGDGDGDGDGDEA